jgi:toxin ParE1/3/4
MNVEWLPVAENDREDQIAYIRERNPMAAINMGDAIQAAVRILSEHPKIGKIGRVNATREFVVARTPYILIYRLEARVIVVLRLLHGAQQWPLIIE